MFPVFGLKAIFIVNSVINYLLVYSSHKISHISGGWKLLAS